MRIRISQHASFLANLAFTLSSVIGMLLMTPLIIKNYGQGIYLLWSLVNSACGLLFIVDFGITSVVAREFLEVFKKTANFSEKVWRGFLVFHGRILLVCSLVVSLVFILQWNQGNIFKFSPQNLLIFIFTLIATLATIVSHQQVLKFQIKNSYSSALAIIALVKIIETIVIILFLYLKISFTFVSMSIAIFHILQVFVLINLANRDLSRSVIDSSIYQHFEPQKLSFVSSILYSASSVLGIHATFILQSLFLAPTQVLVVILSRMVASPIRIFADSLAIGSFDKYIRRSLSNKSGQGTSKHLSMDLWLLLLGFSSIYMVLINSISKFSIEFLSHGQSTPNLLLLNLFCVATILDGSIVIYMQIAISSGNLNNAGSRYFLFTLICLILLVSLNQPFGVYAGVLSIILCDLLFLLIELKPKNRRNYS